MEILDPFLLSTHGISLNFSSEPLISPFEGVAEIIQLQIESFRISFSGKKKYSKKVKKGKLSK